MSIFGTSTVKADRKSIWLIEQHVYLMNLFVLLRGPVLIAHVVDLYQAAI